MHSRERECRSQLRPRPRLPGASNSSKPQVLWHPRAQMLEVLVLGADNRLRADALGGRGRASGLVSTIPVMGAPTVLTEKPFEVARVQAPGGPEGAPEAFMRLEERMDSLRGSRMYGLLYPGEPTAYYACLRLDDDHSDDLGFDRAEVPGGLYGRRLVRDWEDKISELPEIFDHLQADLLEAGFLRDFTRPSLEFYRRSNELLIMMPVLPGLGVRTI